MLDVKAAEAAELLGVPVAQAEALLRHAGWNSERLMEGFWGDGERLSRAAGVEAWGSAAPPSGIGEITCRICFADCAPDEARAAPCGHRFCGDCYGGYARNKVDEGPGCVGMACPEAGCACVVPPDVLDACLDAPRRAKLARFRVENYVSFAKELRWCPGAGCTKVARAGPCVGAVTCAPNGCGATFCFRCGEEAHAPCDCALVARWTEKCQNESETANWILANTKRCPKCQTRIEKNQGCNHMSCSQCKYEFCWMCMGDWFRAASLFVVAAMASARVPYAVDAMFHTGPSTARRPAASTSATVLIRARTTRTTRATRPRPSASWIGTSTTTSVIMGTTKLKNSPRSSSRPPRSA